MDNNNANNGNQNETRDVERQEQENLDSNKKMAQTGLKGAATVAGAYLGGAAGAKIGAKAADVINNTPVGNAITNAAAQAGNIANKMSPTGKTNQALTNAAVNSGAVDLADKGINAAANNGLGKNPTANSQTPKTKGPSNQSGINQDTNPSQNSNNLHFPNQNSKILGKDQRPSFQKNPSRNKQSELSKKHSKHADGSNDDTKENSDQKDNPLKGLNPLKKNNLFPNKSKNSSNEEPETEAEAAKRDLKQFGNILKLAGGIITGIMAILGAIGAFIITHIVLISIILVIAVVAIFISGVIAMVSSFFQYGKEDDGTVCYTTPSCNQIVIKSEEGDKTYSLEDYIAGAIVNYYDHDNYAVADTDVDQNLLKAFSVIIHSDVAAYSDYDSKTETCTINDNSKFQKIYTLNKEEQDDEADDDLENTDEAPSDETTKQETEDTEKAKKDKYYAQAKVAAESVLTEVVDIYTQRIDIFYDGYVNIINTAYNTAGDYKSIIREYIKNSPDYEVVKDDNLTTGTVNDENTIDDNNGEAIGIYPVCSFQKKGDTNSGGTDIGTIVINNLCSQVVVTDDMVDEVSNHTEDFSGVYSYDEFIEGVVANETGYGWSKYPDILKAHAVAARTYLYNIVKGSSKYGSIDGDTCYFTTSTYSMGFRKNTDSAITQAVRDTSGEYIMVNGEISKEARWDAFGYSSKDDNYYTLRQKGLKIPVNWIESRISKETIAYDNKYSHGAGMSQWGAAYLVIEQGKNYKEVIQFFYGADIAKVTDGYVMPINTFTMITGELSVGYCASKSYHPGLDFAAPAGTPVYAATSGVIEKEYSYTYQCLPEYYDKEKTKRNPHYDDCVKGHTNYADNSAGQGFKIKNDDGTYSLYFHFSKKENLHKGDRVTAGQKIGEVGTTGKSTGNHLHYEMRPTSTGKPLEPRNYLPMGGYSICYNNPKYKN